jgi:hypothetical protein
VLVAKGQDIRPHSTASLALATAGAMVTMTPSTRLPTSRQGPLAFFLGQGFEPGPRLLFFPQLPRRMRR